MVVDELGGDRDNRAGRLEQLGLQHLVHVQRRRAVPLGQAIVAMPGAKHEIARAVDQDQEPPLQPRRVQSLHADQPLDHPLPQAGDGSAADFLQEVFQGLVHRPAVLRRARQAIEVPQHLRPICVQLVMGVITGLTSPSLPYFAVKPFILLRDVEAPEGIPLAVEVGGS